MPKYKVVDVGAPVYSCASLVITDGDNLVMYFPANQKEAALDLCAAMNFGAELRAKPGSTVAMITEAAEIARQIEETLEKGHRERVKRYTDAVAKAVMEEKDGKMVEVKPIQFKNGDTVRHVSGGPQMTVTGTDTSNGHHWCECQWQEDSGQIKKETFRMDYLILVKAGEDQPPNLKTLETSPDENPPRGGYF